MPRLKNAKIFRGGATASYLTLETSNCYFEANSIEGSLDLRFNLASKGGGTTSVLLKIGKDDFTEILENLAQAMPKEVAVAVLKVIDAKEARTVKILKDLEVVEEFVLEKRLSAVITYGKDEREANILNKLKKIISSLRE